MLRECEMESALRRAASNATEAISRIYQGVGGEDFIPFVAVFPPRGVIRESSIFINWLGDAAKINRPVLNSVILRHAGRWPKDNALADAYAASLKSGDNSYCDIVFGVIPLYQRHAIFDDATANKLAEQIEGIFKESFAHYNGEFGHSAGIVRLERGSGSFLCPEWRTIRMNEEFKGMILDARDAVLCRSALIMETLRSYVVYSYAGCGMALAVYPRDGDDFFGPKTIYYYNGEFTETAEHKALLDCIVMDGLISARNIDNQTQSKDDYEKANARVMMIATSLGFEKLFDVVLAFYAPGHSYVMYENDACDAVDAVVNGSFAGFPRKVAVWDEYGSYIAPAKK